MKLFKMLLSILLITASCSAQKNQTSNSGLREEKAALLLYKAEDYYRIDSFNLALNGDNVNPGLLTIINDYKGSRAANMANFYAGICFILMSDNSSAIKYLTDFKSDSPPIQARVRPLHWLQNGQ